MSKTPGQIIELVRIAGVVGAGGVGYPTHAKLRKGAETVIVNGSECEPLLYSDKTILKNKAEDLVAGLRLAMVATGARTGIFALNREDADGIRSIEKHAASAPEIQLHFLESYYPAGDELLTVYDVTRKVVPEGGTPSDVGVCVLNVLTVLQIFQAVNGKPVTERVVTITGEVNKPKVVTVPNGTRYSDLIKLADGPKIPHYAVIDGGPMMGRLIEDMNEGIGKSTVAVLLLPAEHLVTRMKQKTVSEMVKESKAASGQNSQSTDLCPRYLIGHAIEPHRAMIALDYRFSEPSGDITAAFLCSGCGLCEVVGNEASFLSPKLIYGEYKRLLTKGNVANPHLRSNLTVHSQFENRKVPTALLSMKLGITAYTKKPSFEGFRDSSFVNIPIQKHVGARSKVIVRTGQSVRRGDVIAHSPLDEECGSVYHASIHGEVSAVTDQFIEITGEVS